MASLLGPQWLCECNVSGGAEDVHSAGVRAARHFISHGTVGVFPYAVSVYKERNDWLYTISEQEHAMNLAYPMQEMRAESTTLTTSAYIAPGSVVRVDTGSGSGPYTYTLSSPMASTLTTLTANTNAATASSQQLIAQYRQPVEMGNLTFAEFQEAMTSRLQAGMAINWNTSR